MRWRRQSCAVLAVAALVAPSAGDAQGAPTRLRPRCPSGALVLRRGDLRLASRTALRYVAGPWAKANRETDVRGASARAARAPATVRGGFARLECGPRIWRRTAVVFVFLPRMAWSASLSTPVFYVSRTRRGFVVWFQIH